MKTVISKVLRTLMIYLLTGVILSLLLAVVRASDELPFVEASGDLLRVFFTFDYGGIAEQVARSRWLVLLNSGKMTLLLILGAIVLIVVLGVSTGVLHAIYPENKLYRIFRKTLMVLSSFPALVTGILIIFLVARFLGLVPFYDLLVTSDWGQTLAIYLLPMMTLALGDGAMAEVMDQAEYTTRRVLRSDYIRAIKARGIPLGYHIIRGLALSVVSNLSSKAAYFVSGAVVVEYLYGWQGLGFQMIDTMTSAGTKDYKLILAATLIFVGFVIVFTLITDLIKYYSDPRLRETS